MTATFRISSLLLLPALTLVGCKTTLKKAGPSAASTDEIPARLSFSVSSLTIHETSQAAAATISLSQSSANTVSVDLAVTPGSPGATLNSDYSLSATHFDFLPGETVKTLTISVVDDAGLENLESAQLQLTSVINAQLGATSTLIVSIKDNDDPTWPGSNNPGLGTTVDDVSTNLAGNASGITFESDGNSSGVMWIVRNGPETLHKLVFNGLKWVNVSGWANGKALRYPSGSGFPDSEGVTVAESGTNIVYVAAERNNDPTGGINSISRNSILRYDVSAGGGTLTATHEWNLTGLVAGSGANLGFEALTWISDADLTGLIDMNTGSVYVPAQYPNHGSGLFFAGLEQNGMIYVFALNHVTSAATKVAQFSSGQAAVMGLEYDRETRLLWAHCDNGCSNAATVFSLEQNPLSSAKGTFVLRQRLNRPGNLPNTNLEGIAFLTESMCTATRKNYFWINDSGGAGTSLYADDIPCGMFIMP